VRLRCLPSFWRHYQGPNYQLLS